jgi:mannose-6-phosphate isomerase-like protein (cupin superfamily)
MTDALPAAVHEDDIIGDRANPPHARTLKHLLAPWTNGSKQLWLGLSIVDPGSSSNPHHHSNEEAFYVVAGEGELMTSSRTFPLTPGRAVLVPSGVEHQLVNHGSEPLKVVCCAAPPVERSAFEAVHL